MATAPLALGQTEGAKLRCFYEMTVARGRRLLISFKRVRWLQKPTMSVLGQALRVTLQSHTDRSEVKLIAVSTRDQGQGARRRFTTSSLP